MQVAAIQMTGPQGVPGPIGPGSHATARLLTKLHQNLADASIVIVGDSTGDNKDELAAPSDEWPTLMAEWLAAQYPAYTVTYKVWASGAAVAYSGTTTIQNGTGSNELTIWNMSVGARDSYFALAPLFQEKIVDPEGDLYIINHGHNEGVIDATFTAAMFRGQYLALTESIRAAVPTASILCIAQNPKTNNQYQAIRVREIQMICELLGYGFVNVHQAFLDYVGDWTTILMADTTHPNVTGQVLWWETMRPAFVWVAGLQGRTINPSTLVQTGFRNILPNGEWRDFTPGAAPAGWTLENAVTLRDTTKYTTAHKYGLRLQAITTGNCRVRCDVPEWAAYKGKTVTIAVPLYSYRATPNVLDGVVGVTDGITPLVTRGDLYSYGGITWRVLTFDVSPVATMLRITLYAGYGAGSDADADVTFGAVYLREGILPGIATDAPSAVASLVGVRGKFFDPDTSVGWQEHFDIGSSGPSTGLIGRLGWLTATPTGMTLGAVNTVASEASYPGILRLSSGAVNPGGIVVRSSQTNMYQPDLPFRLRAIARPGSADTDIGFRFGLAKGPPTISGANNAPTDGFYFEKLPADTAIYAVSRKAGVERRLLTAATHAVAWRDALIVQEIVGTFIFTIAGASVEEASATYITTEYLTAFAFVWNSTAVAKTLDIDFVEFFQAGFSR